MKNITKIISLVLALTVSATAFGAHNQDRTPRKEISPEERECLDDARKFVRSYDIIMSVYNHVLEEKEEAPETMIADKVQAEMLYYKFKKHMGARLAASSFAGSVTFTGGSWAASICEEMYNHELNDDYGVGLYPESGHVFKESNLACNTSYKQAKINMREVLDKYEAGMHACPKDR